MSGEVRLQPDGTAAEVVVGDIISGTADDGSAPVKIGGRFNTTKPTLTDGQRGDAQLTTKGALLASLGVTASGAAFGEGVPADAQAGLVGLWVVTQNEAFNGATWDRVRAPNVIKTVAATAITAGTGATIWTPTAGKKFRLMGWSLSVSAGASLIFGDNLVATVILRSELLAAAGVSQNPPGFGNGFLSAAINNVLKLDVTATATVSGYVFGTEE